ncbi:ABC transporter permease [Aestuariivirga sp.]|uniref:ABC transporter permease n=1 Tax=Aestuariivirga sp. TaxID=2650926 RepID=UPI0025C1B8F6|nr:ABC transporter permease [Aestuariivirga sp.]MCA3555664.1 ABC transporter permease [Aestuariivirga sp.]
MAQALPNDGVMRAADGTPLKVALARAGRAERLKAVALVLPLFAFIIFSFVVPIFIMLYNSVYDPDVAENMPRTVLALKTWDGKDLPPEEVFAAFVADMKTAQQNKQTALIGKRLNYEMSGIRSKVVATGRKIGSIEAAPYRDQVIAIDKVWGQPETWATIKRSSSDYTPFYILSMLDLRQTPDGSIEAVPADRAIYRSILARTLGISLLVTLLTLVLGYPVAYLLATSPQRTASILMIFVLLPFWTSLLVRTTAWMVLMTDGGVFAGLLHFTGITWFLNLTGVLNGEPQLFKTRFATVVAMTHIQLPFTLLPIYSVMKTISPTYMRAAKSLGGTPFYSFLRVYMPQTLPGVAAGCLLTFILCLGYYITPAIVGGPTDQMISGFIERAINSENNWGKASALGVILLTATLILYYVYNKLVGIDRMKLG